MATRICPEGHRTWSGERDREGYVDYHIVHRVESDTSLDGPQVVSATAGLPQPGDYWLVDNDADVWAWCRWDMRVTPVDSVPPTRFWDVEQLFSTRPEKNCRDFQVQDPLLEPIKVSGSDESHKVEVGFDRFGRAVLSSSHEHIRGPQVEFDDGNSVVVVEQNVASLELDVCTAMRNRVNGYPLWGMPRRTIKLNRFTWEAQYYGACLRYYKRRFEFGVNANGFDRDLVDEGTKALNGKWDRQTGLWTLIDVAGEPPDPNNPTHFIRYKDRNGENARVVLDGAGKPFVPELNDVVFGCGPCAQEGAPKYWHLMGFEEDPLVLLTHSGGCSWSGTSADELVDYELSYDSGSDSWSVTSGLYPGQAWVVEDEMFWCLGPNSLKNNATFLGAGNWDGPPLVSVHAGWEPGVVHVEYYPEADFLLLGIPAIL